MYEAPEVRRLGTLDELTQTHQNKIGPSPDVFSQVVPIVGSIVTIP